MTQEENIQVNGISEELFKKALNIFFDIYRDRTKAIRELSEAVRDSRNIQISRNYINDSRIML